MRFPTTITFYQQNQQSVVFGPVLAGAAPNAPITDATLVMTVYRNRINATGGIPVPGAIDVSFTSDSGGTYTATIGDQDWLPEAGPNYVAVFDLDSPESGPQHWEVAATVDARSS